MYLGLDLGTTNIKALLVDDAGKVVAEGAAPVGLRHVGAGGVEQDIQDIWRSAVAAVKTATGAFAAATGKPAAVRAVGISSQGGAIQIRSGQGQPIGPVIGWMDTRGSPFDRQFDRQVGQAWLQEHVGHGMSGVSIGQVLRLRQEQPGLLAEPNQLGYVGDTIVQRMCGQAAHDCSSLSIATLYNPYRRSADEQVLAMLGLDERQLPLLLPARHIAGALTAEAASAMSLPAGIPISPAIHDQYMAALGCGALNAGDLMFGAGTAWAMVAAGDHLAEPVVPLAWVCDHVVPGRWAQMLSLVVGGSAFGWALELTGLAGQKSAEIDAVLTSVPPGCDGLRLWPFLDGWGGANRLPAGRLDGLRLTHSKAHLLRATVEGLCLELSRQIGWLVLTGWPVKRLIMCGGGARSQVTPQIVSDVTGRPVDCPANTSVSAFGAAVLARSLVEPDESLERLWAKMAGPTRRFAPSQNADLYRQLAAEYQRGLGQP